MSPEKQRIAIAEACGWNHAHYSRDLSESVGHDVFRGQPPGRRDYYGNLPDYLADLNAMHEAEKTLDVHQWIWYVTELAAILLNEVSRDLMNYEGSVNFDNVYCLIHATAAQRAEAFLRTIGKWEDS